MTDAEIKQAMRAIAAVNGLPLSDERIERDFATYKSYLDRAREHQTSRSADGRGAHAGRRAQARAAGADDGTLETRVCRSVDRRRVRDATTARLRRPARVPPASELPYLSHRRSRAAAPHSASVAGRR